jgi:hypothetical protein
MSAIGWIHGHWLGFLSLPDTVLGAKMKETWAVPLRAQSPHGEPHKSTCKEAWLGGSSRSTCQAWSRGAHYGCAGQRTLVGAEEAIRREVLECIG